MKGEARIGQIDQSKILVEKLHHLFGHRLVERFQKCIELLGRQNSLGSDSLLQECFQSGIALAPFICATRMLPICPCLHLCLLCEPAALCIIHYMGACMPKESFPMLLGSIPDPIPDLSLRRCNPPERLEAGMQGRGADKKRGSPGFRTAPLTCTMPFSLPS